MTKTSLAKEHHKALKQQQNEINDYAIYSYLASVSSEAHNKEVFLKIAKEEHEHYQFWTGITKQQIKPQKWLVIWYVFLVKIFGAIFALKSLEKREKGAELFYKELGKIYPESKKIYQQEMHHEKELLNMLHDIKLVYAGAIVLGMNDALVELTGTLSGLALAFDKTMVVGMTGLIMGIAASLSMAGSAFLESRESSDTEIRPLIYALYTGMAYVLTTAFLISSFFIFSNMKIALLCMFIFALTAILLYTFYVSVAKDLSFCRRALEMSAITFGVTLISFGVGYVVKHYFGLSV